MLATSTFGAAVRDRDGQQASQHRTRKTEEQEQNLRVEGVGTRRGERRTEVVADEPAARKSRLEIARRPTHLGVRGRGIAGEPARELRVDLRAYEVGPGLRQRIEELVPFRARSQDHIVGGCLRLRADRRADLLEE
jgi:hypothetical protein